MIVELRQHPADLALLFLQTVKAKAVGNTFVERSTGDIQPLDHTEHCCPSLPEDEREAEEVIDTLSVTMFQRSIPQCNLLRYRVQRRNLVMLSAFGARGSNQPERTVMVDGGVLIPPFEIAAAIATCAVLCSGRQTRHSKRPLGQEKVNR